MITINESDTNLPEVLSESKLSNLVTKEKYYVYGLRREQNPVVLIEYDNDYVSDDFRKAIKSLTEFFNLNGISMETINDNGERGVDIGLRIDLRKVLNRNNKPLLAGSVLSTIVYCLENRVDTEQMKKHKLSSIPKFED